MIDAGPTGGARNMMTHQTNIITIDIEKGREIKEILEEVCNA